MLIFFSWGLGGLPDTNFGEIANLRWNKSISGFNKIKSKEEYIKKLEEYLGQSGAGKALFTAKTRSWESISEDAYSNSSAVDVVEANTANLSEEKLEIVELKAQAISFEKERPFGERYRDESRTARDTRSITPMNYKSWSRKPSRMDLRGIDTRQRRYRRSARRVLVKEASKRIGRGSVKRLYFRDDLGRFARRGRGRR